jgi:hypothetical protein
MQRYNFIINKTIYSETEIKVCKEKVIKYKCLICGFAHEYDDTWTDEKKAEVQAEMDTHHNEHIIH